MKILIVVEPTTTGYSAYAPDIPGCAGTGGTREVVEKRMREALELHLVGERVPEAHSYATYVDVGA